MDLGMRVRVAVIVAVMCTAVAYGATVRLGLDWGDSAELALQAHRLGVTHPPGYPLHSLVGHVAGQVIEPITATTLLSLLGTLEAVGILTAVVTATSGTAAGVFSGLVFGLHPLVWSAAIRTEVYNVNMALVGLCLAALVWPGELTRRRVAIAITSFALSFGSSPANVLLVPGVVVLVARSTRGSIKTRRLLVLLVALGVVGCALTVWTIFRSRIHPPLGTPAMPHTLTGFVRFVSGLDYDVLTVHGPRFYLGRIQAHFTAFLADFAWVGGALGILGLVRLWRLDREIALGSAIALAGNLGYFTFHPWPDYRIMVTPSYFVFAFWCGLGFGVVVEWALRASWPTGPVRRATRLVAVLLLGTVPGIVAIRALRYENEHRIPGDPDAFVEQAFAVFPPQAVVLTRWIYFTPLLYAQEVRGLRPDLRIVEVADGPRHQGDLRVTTWHEVATAAAGQRPIVTNVPEVSRRTRWRTEPLGHGWRIVAPPRLRVTKSTAE